MTQELQASRPSPPSWLDRNFIQTALRAGDNDPAICVLSCDVTMANAEGDGYGSDMYRVSAKLQDAEERYCIVKCQLQGGKMEDFAIHLDMFGKEAKMLTETLPAMNTLMEVATPGEFRPFVPKCLHHGEDPIPFLVMEDLKQSGFTLAKRTIGLDLNECSLVVKTLANFHALSLVLENKDPSYFEYYKTPMCSEEHRDTLSPMFENPLRSLEQSVLKWPGYEKYFEKLKRLREKAYDIMKERTSMKPGELNTLVHGDVWTNNIMFKYSNGKVVDIRLIDFQTAHVSSPSTDLQYFLSSCPNEDVRDKAIDVLLNEYHETFSETLDKLEFSSLNFTLESLRRDFLSRTDYGFIAATTIIPYLMGEPSKMPDMNDLLSQDDGTVDLLSDIVNSDACERLFKKLLVRCEFLGVL